MIVINIIRAGEKEWNLHKWICNMQISSVHLSFSPFPPMFARPSSETNAGTVFDGEGVNPSLAYKDLLSLTLMWTWIYSLSEELFCSFKYCFVFLYFVLLIKFPGHLVNFLRWIRQCVHFYVDGLETAKVFQTSVNFFGIFHDFFKCVHLEERLNFLHH